MLRLIFNLNTWKQYFSLISLTKNALSAFGVLWLVVEILSFFLDVKTLNLKPYWYIFLACGLIWTLKEIAPKKRYAKKLTDMDVTIEIVIGNIFKQQGALIIPTNTTFDTDISLRSNAKAIVSEKSIQGQFTNKHYGNRLAVLDNELENSLAAEPFVTASKSYGKQKEYALGTVASLHSGQHNYYWLAMAKLNNHATAGTTRENIRTALATLWNHLSVAGDYEENIVIPVLGTGFSRVATPREEIIKDIIQSFIAACRNTKFCQKLTIVINASDYIKNGMNLKMLHDYLRLNTEFHTSANSKNAEGAPIT